MGNIVTGILDAVENGTVFRPEAGKAFNFTLSGTFAGTVRLARQFDETGGFYPLTALGEALEFTGPCTEVFEEVEGNVAYRAECTSYSSGTITYRLSQ